MEQDNVFASSKFLRKILEEKQILMAEYPKLKHPGVEMVSHLGGRVMRRPKPSSIKGASVSNEGDVENNN